MSLERGTRLTDYLAFLAHLEWEGLQPVLVGGHGVNVWAELLLEREPRLAAFAPFTSKDLDPYRPPIEVLEYFRAIAWRVIDERDPFGKAWTPVGTIFHIRAADGRELSVDNLKSLHGLTAEEIRRATISVGYHGVGLRVLTPVAAFKAKCRNFVEIQRFGRQDDKHVRILALCVPAFLRDLIDTAIRAGEFRPLLNQLEAVMHTTEVREVVAAATTLGVDLRELLPLTQLREFDHPKIRNFVEHRLPHWLSTIQPLPTVPAAATSAPVTP